MTTYINQLLSDYAGKLCEPFYERGNGHKFFSSASIDLSPYYASTTVGIKTPDILTSVIPTYYQLAKVLNQVAMAGRRYINNHCYSFLNLPLWITNKEAISSDPIAMPNPSQLTMTEFIKLFLDGGDPHLRSIAEDLGHQITSLSHQTNVTIQRNPMLPHTTLIYGTNEVTCALYVPRVYGGARDFNDLFNQMKGAMMAAPEHTTTATMGM